MTNVYTPTFISTATTTAITTGTTVLHSINFPKATAGIVTLEKSDGTDYLAFPIGSIGCFILDCVLPGGTQIITASADFVIITTSK